MYVLSIFFMPRKSDGNVKHLGGKDYCILSN